MNVFHLQGFGRVFLCMAGSRARPLAAAAGRVGGSRPGRNGPPRRGAMLLLFAALLVVVLGLAAFAVDIGFITLTRTQLQVAADSAAMAAAATMAKSPGEVLAVARQYAGYHIAGGRPVRLNDQDVEFGFWDPSVRKFTPSRTLANAIRVTARCDQSTGGQAPLFFAQVFRRTKFASRASAVAMANSRDIAFVVDLSGSMNDDTEPCWATAEIDQTFASEGYPTIGSQLLQQVFDDLGFGSSPGVLQYLGQPWGVSPDEYAYAELTKDGGPLDQPNVPGKYRIFSSDSEVSRKRKAYSAIIDFQLARIMPAARPAPDSNTSFDYWEKYLDYVIAPVSIRRWGDHGGPGKGQPGKGKPRGGAGKGHQGKGRQGKGSEWGRGTKGRGGGKQGSFGRPEADSGDAEGPSSPEPSLGILDLRSRLPQKAPWNEDPFPARVSYPAEPLPGLQVAMLPGHREGLLYSELLLAATTKGTPPYNRGVLPPHQDSDQIIKFNNPNLSTFPEANRRLPASYRNRLGYLTYVQFLMDFGRDLKPDDKQYSPLSVHSRYCPRHSEATAGGMFSFPPREQPVHAVRRALIAAMQLLKERNSAIPEPEQRDWVCVISFDGLSSGGPVLQQSLTGDYEAAMLACTSLQAVGDKGPTTATEAGLIAARNHLRPSSQGGQGRPGASKVVVLLTDGVPNLYVSSNGVIEKFMRDHPRSEFYGHGAYWYDAALMQALAIGQDNWMLFPVAVGLGADYDFMDRLARLGGTADEEGRSPRGTGNPAEYERRLTAIFEKIIANPKVRLVQ